MIVAIDSDASYHHSGYWLPRPIFVCEHINFPSQVIITGALAAYLLRGARGPFLGASTAFAAPWFGASPDPVATGRAQQGAVRFLSRKQDGNMP